MRKFKFPRLAVILVFTGLAIAAAITFGHSTVEHVGNEISEEA